MNRTSEGLWWKSASAKFSAQVKDFDENQHMPNFFGSFLNCAQVKTAPLKTAWAKDLLYRISFFKGMKTCTYYLMGCKVQKMNNNPHHAHVKWLTPVSINFNHCALPEHRLFGIFLKDLAISSVIWALNLKVQKFFNISQREKLFD